MRAAGPIQAVPVQQSPPRTTAQANSPKRCTRIGTGGGAGAGGSGRVSPSSIVVRILGALFFRLFNRTRRQSGCATVISLVRSTHSTVQPSRRASSSAFLEIHACVAVDHLQTITSPRTARRSCARPGRTSRRPRGSSAG